MRLSSFTLLRPGTAARRGVECPRWCLAEASAPFADNTLRLVLRRHPGVAMEIRLAPLQGA